MGRPHPVLYGLDIETDTSVDGLDPGVARIVAVALSGAELGEIVFTGSEQVILGAVDDTIATLPPGILVTWNGSSFDLPYLADRARRIDVPLGLELFWNPGIDRRGRPPLPGHIGSFEGRWWHLEHLDAYRAWRDLTPDLDISCALKEVARREGIDAIEVDRETVHQLTIAALQQYVGSDATVARLLAASRWNAMRRYVDRPPTSGQLALGSC